MKTYKMSDKAIAEIVNIIQKGMLEFRDVTEDFRNMKLTISDETNELVPDNTNKESNN